MAKIPFPLSSRPGLNPQESAGRLVNSYAVPLGETGPAAQKWTRVPGVDVYADTALSSPRGGIEVAGALYYGMENAIVAIRDQFGPDFIATGTAIGDMTDGDGLEAAFNGTTSEAAADCAQKSSAQTSYIGKTFDTARPIHSVSIFGSNDAGYVSGDTPNITATLYGKNGDAPEDETDGTVLGFITFTDTSDESDARQIVTTDRTKEWTHVWVTIEQDATAAQMNVAELQIYAAVFPTLTTQGTLSGTDELFFARNMAAPDPDIVVVGESGVFVINSNGVEAYPDNDVGAPNSVCYLLGFFIFSYGNGAMQASDINSTDINTNNQATAEDNPDGLLRVVPWSGRLYAFGTRSVEIWGQPINDGGFPFNRLHVAQLGLIGKYALAGHEDGFGRGLVFVGTDSGVYLLDAYEPAKISTPELDALIEKVADKNTINVSVYISNGHAFAQVSCPDWCYVFNLNNQKWHERNSWLQNTSRVTGTLLAFNKWIAGDKDSGLLGEITHTVQTEFGDPLPVLIESGPVAQFPARTRVARADFNFISGVGDVTGISPIQTDPEVRISWSDDGGVNWSPPRPRPLGQQQDPHRLITVRNTGMARHQGRRWRLQISDPVYLSLLGGEQSAELRR